MAITITVVRKPENILLLKINDLKMDLGLRHKSSPFISILSQFPPVMGVKVLQVFNGLLFPAIPGSLHGSMIENFTGEEIFNTYK
ncbi:unnamed protein product [Euphydryas editha]|uniref:Uncharacterized protein n=1 Tax=Euphydryas editha TaxID=104508 RepID=A0AAU9TT88_EUPED|nr:unnamed protein product [Euphydryas editha]